MNFKNLNENLDWDNNLNFSSVYRKRKGVLDKNRECGKKYNWIYAQKHNAADKKHFIISNSGLF